REAVARDIEEFASQHDVTRKVGEPGRPDHGLRKNGEEFPVEGSISKLRMDDTLTITASIRDVTQSRRMEAEQRVLADLGQALSSTLDYESTLTNVLRLTARELGELIALYIADRGDVRRVRAASRHPTHSPWFAEVPAEHQRVVGPQHPARQLIVAAKPVVMAVSPEVLDALAINPDHRRALEAAHIRSAMGIPLCIGDECLGALVIQSSSRVYGPEDLRLAEEVGNRTALFVKNAQLHQIARRAIQDRDDVLRIVAHDLKNPLSTIVMEADILRLSEHIDDHGPRDVADAITRAANRMTRLVRDLLDVSRMDSEPLAVTQARLSASAVIADLAKLEEPLASAAGLAFRCDVAPDAGDVFADRDRLLQALENLVSNAIRHTHRGGRVTIGVKRNADAVVFSVSDTGSGIPKTALPFVFDRFARQRQVDKGNTGLGLPIVKGIVEAHGGNVWAESEVGAGSTFYFTIPKSRPNRRS
ncbi:MAG TPA: ATP-binding protein, partial [Gemmatimonadaceae bacterium]